jgi:predicted transglutaminase-like cysteine proteinase
MAMRLDLSRLKQVGRAAAVLLLLGLTAQADRSEPFGLVTVAAPEGPLWTTWRRLQAEIKAEQPVIAQCRAKPQSCRSPAARQFIAIVDEGAPFQGLARIGHINRAANLAIRAINDATPSKLHSQWTSPLTTLAAGAGDCKQYAVLKYAALQDGGFAAEDVRIVIVGQRTQPGTHAVVAVHNEGHWLILDSRSLAIVEASALLDRYVPLDSFDRRGVREFVDQPQVAQEFGAACAG